MKTARATLLIALFTLSIFAVAMPVSAQTTYYVATTGDDTTGVGSELNPWLTISFAVTQVLDDDTIIVAAGTYNEQAVIDKSITLQGVGDTTIIQPSGAGVLLVVKATPWIGGGTKPMAAIVFVETAGGQVTVKDLKIDGSLIAGVPAGVGTGWVTGLAYLETSGTIEGLTVIGNPSLACRTCGIWASATTETTLVEVTGCTVTGYNRAGIYALGGTITGDYHHNDINGPGALTAQVPNGMFFLEGAKGSATYNTVTDLGYTGEQYRSTGIGTYHAGANIVFSNNEISNVQNAFALSMDTIGTTVEYNNIHNCHTGVRIEAGATNSIIQYNDIHNNDFAIRCGSGMGEGNIANYNNFVDNPGVEEVLYGETYIGAVCNINETYVLDAEYNWWGTTDPSVIAGMVSGLVDYDPWLNAAFPGGQPMSSGSLTMTANVRMPMISITVNPPSVDFGTIIAGRLSDTVTVTITNTGETDELVTVELTYDPIGFYETCLTIDGTAYDYAGWSKTVVEGATSDNVELLLDVPKGYTAGTYEGTLVFWAEEA